MMGKKLFAVIVVVLLNFVGISSVQADAFWTNAAGDGDFCNTGNWNEDPPQDVESYIDAGGLTGASCSITVDKLKGP